MRGTRDIVFPALPPACAVVVLWACCALSAPTIPVTSALFGADTGAEQRRIDWEGTEELRQGRYEEAIEVIEADTEVVDSGLRYFKLGIACSRLERHRDALFHLRLAARHSPELEPFAYELIGDVEQKLGRPANASFAYRTALQADIPPRYSREVRRKIFATLRSDSTLAAQIWWFGKVRKTEEITREPWVPAFFDTLLAEKRWRLADSVLSRFLDETETENRCAIYSLLEKSSFPDSLLSTKQLFQLSKLAYDCGKYSSSSDRLHAALDRPDFSSTVPRKEYLFHRGMLNYRLDNYNKCITWFEEYEKSYGLTPTLVLTVARAYRALGKTTRSAVWYDKHVKLYPAHAMTHDIIWYRAWQKEEQGKYRGAITFFRRLYRSYPGGKRADDSFFRSGLCFYKLAEYDSAAQTFREHCSRYGRSSMRDAARYWLAKSLSKLKKRTEANAIFKELAQTDPVDYYAYRAREMLTIGGDTTVGMSLDSVVDPLRTRMWLDSISKNAEDLSPADSEAYYWGSLLALVGLVSRAEYYLEPLILGYPKNLALQFDLASIFEACRAPTLAYRVARRFAWRVPLKYRSEMPTALYGALYPFPFREAIVRSALEFGVDPFLVCAVMRQESIFDDQIVSPAGAVGLMQIMPYTGEEIAGDLKVSFAVDSLYRAETNIRFGTYYLSKLLNQFNGSHVLALAGYNGGPHNARKWYNRNKDRTLDMFIEDIGYSETRLYVKKVLANYWTYRHLAGLLGYPGA